VVTTIALVCLPKVACGCGRSAPRTFGVAAKYKSPRANAEKSGDAGNSMCKMQTATIAHDFVVINKAQPANGNAFSRWYRATCNILVGRSLLMLRGF
jgi:hypothetical protein